MKIKRILSMLLCISLVGSFTACRKTPATQGSEELSDEIEYVYVNGSGDSEGNADAGDGNTLTANGKTDSKKDNKTDKGNKGNTGKTDSSKKDDKGGSTITQEDVSNTNKTGFPIVKNKEKIKIMTVTRASDIGDTNKSQFTQYYSKLTNMDITFDIVEDSAIAQRKTLALQSGNLPDIFTNNCKISDQDMQQYSAEGTFIEITKDMLNTWAPNIVKFYDKYKLWDVAKSPDGKMYSIVSMTNDFNYEQHYLWINKTWLDKLGLKMPTTMSEYYDVLKAFKTQDPNGNGTNDEVPYATWSSGGFFTMPWGVSTGLFVNKNGKLAYGGATENIKKAATWWNKVYKENLVDKNTIDNWAGDNAAFQTLIASGKVGSFYYGWPSFDEKLLKQYVICPWPTSGEDNGDYYPVYTNVQNNTFPNGFIITKACKNVAAALRFLDYLYTNDGYMLTLYGKPGYLYTKVNDTTYKLTGKTATSDDILGPQWTLRGRYFLDGAKLEGNNSNDWVRQQRKIADNEMAARVKKYGQKTMPNEFKTKTEVKAINQYSTYFNSAYTFADYVKGTRSLTGDFTQMQNTLSKKGLSKYLKAWQDYYDRVK